ncbi:serine/threonine protein kinase [Fusarium oxysporum f. sp. lycopersici 4287]|uniref:Serine/threonine protein kinase n=1 Tax=Fusarium oxysporum f. sp. lycopersici (strain 4287 / CBS 123668 / FGSC 9935 / NRRL 34936) TaxID=426428 RepID=A0A0J9V0N0_FUSO4|nr:serine/threonine protein kinase [Fusarium oxysporum f. sp. lycopersici 4287]XP_018244670.1 serine/threonine protein kinase [Fusarium oxysporum f. sp. lycopersici 4287]XP_018256967.1 serine/threonine protein kinase [Fusarium oxysporum f. sp. lycopersici 4287]KNB04698.1 serine/threonine protein kinase [Fusarium oxysporum f. sp. lycopersici 4287]KNB06625.1 serine/threonine protein kinase [Fusarium oxysporum f. sp. lycopersici 4287]KNB18922.1 serine/threonine protein kinase [Fusarium oxysporum 
MTASTYSQCGITDRSVASSASNGSKELETDDHYQVFLSIQRMLRTFSENIVEFPDKSGWTHRIEQPLGAGGCSSVSRVLGKHSWGRNPMAFKRVLPILYEYGGRNTKEEFTVLLNELRVCSVARVRTHPNLNTLNGVSFEPMDPGPDPTLFPALILDPSPLGNLLNLISDPFRMVDGPYWECSVDVANGLKALHENGIVHGDIKCENVLVFAEPENAIRPFCAKLTDFGCSMVLAETEPYAMLKGRTMPYDAPEADRIIPKHILPFSDVYSFGLLVWRVALDGADPFTDPRYWEELIDGERHYRKSNIREAKKGEGLLNYALSTIRDPDLQHAVETADAFCEILNIALRARPEKRDLDRILLAFARNKNNFKTRDFGLSSTGGYILRQFVKAEIGALTGASESQLGLSRWQSLPDTARSKYAAIQALEQDDIDFRGLHFTRHSRVFRSVQKLLKSSETLLSVLGQDVPTLETIAPDSTTHHNSLLPPTDLIANMLSKDFAAAQRAAADECHRMADFLNKQHAWLEPSLTLGSFDEPGGLATHDSASLNEPTKTASPLLMNEPLVAGLDFDLLLSCGLPFTIQKQIYAALSIRIGCVRTSDPSYPRYMVEKAICHLLGFGVAKNHEIYLSALAECYELGYRPAQVILQRVHAALGIALPQNALTSRVFNTVEDAESPVRNAQCETESLCCHLGAEAVGDNLHDAATSGSISTVVELLAEGSSNINCQNAAGDTPLLCACRSGHADVVASLLDAGADAGIVNALGESPLHWIVRVEAREMSALTARLLAHGARVDEVAKVNHGPSPDVANDCLVAGTAIHRAVAHGNKDAVQALLAQDARADIDGGPIIVYDGHSRMCDPIQLACMSHEAEILEMMLDVTPFYPINASCESEVGLLYFAIQCQNTHRRMVRHGSDFYYRMLATIDLLVRRGSTNHVRGDGLTALHLAATHGTADILEHLLTLQPFVGDITTLVEGRSPLHWAIVLGDEVKFDILVHHGADTLHSCPASWLYKADIPILELATRTMRSDFYFVKRLFKINGDLPQREKDVALRTAFVTRQFGLAEFLLKRGADINAQIRHTTLLESILPRRGLGLDGVENYISLCRKYSLEADVVVMPETGDTALHCAAGILPLPSEDRYSRLYTLLFELFPCKSHLEARNSRGFTPLHMAALFRNVVAIKAFVEAGADINSMALFEGVPVGPTLKDLVFTDIFAPNPLYDFDKRSRRKGDRAQGEIIDLLKSSEIRTRAKRSKTLRSQFRRNASPREKRVSDFVSVMTLLPESLPMGFEVSMMEKVCDLLNMGADEELGELVRELEGSMVEHGRSVQWTNLEKIRFLDHQGKAALEKIGILDLYEDIDEADSTS